MNATYKITILTLILLFLFSVSVSALDSQNIYPGYRNSIYLANTDPSVVQYKVLTASDKLAGDEFGLSVAISEDCIIIGAPSADRAGIRDAGMVYFYQKDKGGKDEWGESARIASPEKENGSFFGISVAISSDYAIIGSRKQVSDKTSNTGAAYICHRTSDGNWKIVAEVKPSGENIRNNFGNSVSISGDYAIVGANKGSSDGIKAGAAYIFRREGDSPDRWKQIAVLNSSSPERSDYFGYSTGISGDYAIVGAPTADAMPIFTGRDRIYIFNKNKGGEDKWGQVAEIGSPEPDETVWFGNSVAISGDCAIAGAWYAEMGDFHYPGVAYILSKDAEGDGNWSITTSILPSGSYDCDNFARAVSISGDSALAGATGADPAGSSGGNAGAAYIYRKETGTAGSWDLVAGINASVPLKEDYFGMSVSISGDYAIIGTSGADPDGVDRAGATYLFVIENKSSEEIPPTEYQKGSPAGNTAAETAETCPVAGFPAFFTGLTAIFMTLLFYRKR